MKVKLNRSLAALINNHPEIGGPPVTPGGTIDLTPSVLKILQRTKGVIFLEAAPDDEPGTPRLQPPFTPACTGAAASLAYPDLLHDYARVIARELLHAAGRFDQPLPNPHHFARSVMEMADALATEHLAAWHKHTQPQTP